MFDYLWIFHALYYRCRMAHFCNILPTGCKLKAKSLKQALMYIVLDVLLTSEATGQAQR